jgi:zinc protease
MNAASVALGAWLFAVPTGAPTTNAPTTNAPTTNAPTTNAPTTNAPTTNAPTTNAPTTNAPGKATAGAIDEFRRQQPAAGPASAFVVPAPLRFTAGGVDVFLVERHDLPLVSASLGFTTGAVADPRDKAGLAGLCAATMGEGPARLTKVAFEETQADLAASVGFGAGTEQSGGSARALTTTFPAALDLLVELVARPGLRPDDFARVQARQVNAVAQQRGSAEAVAGRVQGRVVWGADHALGAVVTEASLRNLALADCAAFARRLGPRGARLFVVGDITRDALTRLVEASAKKHAWKGAAPAAVSVAPTRAGTGGVVAVDVPGAAQSVLLVLAEGPARAAPDHEAQAIMLSILGGGFSSRVNMNLREKHGYTYGARAGVGHTRTRGVFSMSTSVRTDVTAPAIRELLVELRTMQGGAVTDEELARERDGALQAFPARFATGAGIADAWATVAFHGLPKDTWDKTPARLAAVDAGAVARAARAVLPSSPTLLVVGDLARIGPDLERIAAEGLFGDGMPLRRLDPDGNAVITVPGPATPATPAPTPAPTPTPTPATPAAPR